eukprot:TRINITY_DN10066_c0_g1_i3.p1 TRINITY_DN10066_c0_g1~~TRINITY_DN10066_c0_g1_i3.p1  ORF type:complete len:476 (-),score=115.76 TRINITY_DN10066_c0_g1_i3:507-1745(-)
MELKRRRQELDEMGDDEMEETSETEDLLNQMIETDDWDHESILGMEPRELILLLSFLCDQAMSSWVIRKAIDKRVDRLEELENMRLKVRGEHLRARTGIIEENHQTTIGAALCLNDIVNEVSQDGKWVLPSLVQLSVEKMRHQKIESSLEFMKYEQQLNFESLSSGVRGVSLGIDRAGTHYLLLGADYSRVFVRKFDLDDSSKDVWTVLTPAQVVESISCFSPRIWNEYQLSWNLRRYFVDANLLEVFGPKNFSTTDDPYVFFLQDSYPFASSKKYRPELFDTLNRCKLCQDIWKDENQVHCDGCHVSFPREDFRHACPKGEYPDISSLTLWARVAKSSLLDLQVAIPVDAYVVKKSLSGDAALQWRTTVKRATTIAALVEALSDLETRIDRGFVAKEYNRYQLFEVLDKRF